jgi:hypothetical protein
MSTGVNALAFALLARLEVRRRQLPFGSPEHRILPASRRTPASVTGGGRCPTDWKEPVFRQRKELELGILASRTIGIVMTLIGRFAIDTPLGATRAGRRCSHSPRSASS